MSTEAKAQSALVLGYGEAGALIEQAVAEGVESVGKLVTINANRYADDSMWIKLTFLGGTGKSKYVTRQLDLDADGNVRSDSGYIR